MNEIKHNVDELLEKEFEIVNKGYSPKQVDAFLDEIIADYESINAMFLNHITAKEFVGDKYDSVVTERVDTVETKYQGLFKEVDDEYNEALENVKKSDYTRAAYYRSISGKKWGNPHNYTLCLDSSIGIEFCVDQICYLYNKMSEEN